MLDTNDEDGVCGDAYSEWSAAQLEWNSWEDEYAPCEDWYDPEQDDEWKVGE